MGGFFGEIKSGGMEVRAEEETTQQPATLQVTDSRERTQSKRREEREREREREGARRPDMRNLLLQNVLIGEQPPQ